MAVAVNVISDIACLLSGRMWPFWYYKRQFLIYSSHICPLSFDLEYFSFWNIVHKYKYFWTMKWEYIGISVIVKKIVLGEIEFIKF
jgi:hypothetical protein